MAVLIFLSSSCLRRVFLSVLFSFCVRCNGDGMTDKSHEIPPIGISCDFLYVRHFVRKRKYGEKEYVMLIPLQ